MRLFFIITAIYGAINTDASDLLSIYPALMLLAIFAAVTHQES